MGNFVGRVRTDIGLSEKATDIVFSCVGWPQAMNLIRRGLRNNCQEDLDRANSIILPSLVENGIWDGVEGKPIDRDTCSELWRYIKTITKPNRE